MAAVLLIDNQSGASTVLRKVEVKLEDNQWYMYILDSPTSGASNDFSTLTYEEQNNRKLYVRHFFYQCKSSANFCTLKE